MTRRVLLACLAMVAAFLHAAPADAAPYVSTKIQYGFPIGWVPEIEAHANLGYSSSWAVGNDISGVDDALAAAQTNGTIPMIMWYYWGGHISPSCVENVSNADICGGRTRNLWTSKSQEMANLIATMRPSSTTVVVVEPEFQVAGNYEPLDDYMVAIANIFKNRSANIKIVSGFAEWANSTTYTQYNEIGAAAHYSGTQVLFSCINQTQAEYLNAVERIVSNATQMQQTHFQGKPVFVYDFGLSSYSGASSNDPDYATAPLPKDCKTSGNYEQHQEAMMRAVFTEKARMKEQGVIGFVFREYYDEINRPSWKVDYHLIAEKWWGIRRNYGGVNRAKLAWQPVIDGIKAENGGGGGPIGGGGYAPALTVGANSSSTWMEVFAGTDVTGVDVIVNNGAYMFNLPKTTWGSYARSPSPAVPAGTPVQLVARRSSDNASAGTIVFPWLQDSLPDTVPGWAGSIARGANCSTTWAEFVISSGATSASLKDDTDAWETLEHRPDWGKWVRSTSISAGSKVIARATNADGHTAYSPIFTWMQ